MPITISDTLEVHLNKEVVRPSLVLDDYLRVQLNKYIDESFILSDYLEVVPPYPPGVKYLADSFVLLDVLSKVVDKKQFDVFTLSDIVSKDVSKYNVDILSILDALVKQISKPYTESLSFLDYISKQLSKLCSEETIFVDAIAKYVSKLNVESFTLADVFSRLVNYLRALSDEYSLLDYIDKDYVKAPLTEATTLMDYICKQPFKPLFDSLTLLDYLVKQPNVFRDEAVSITDAYSRIVQFERKLIDAMVFSEIVMALRPGLSFSELLTFIDSLVKAIGVKKEEPISLIDLLKKDVVKWPFIEQLALADYISKGSGKPLFDVLTFIEALSKDMRIPKEEAFSILDVYSRTAAFVRQWLDAFVFSEIVVVPKPGLFFSETLTLLDYLTKRPGKLTSEVLTMFAELRYTPGKFVQETLAFVDEFKRQIEFKLSLLDYVGLKPYELVYLPELGVWVIIVEKKEGGIGILVA